VAGNELCVQVPLLKVTSALNFDKFISLGNRAIVQMTFLFQEVIPIVAVLLLHSSSRECYWKILVFDIQTLHVAGPVK
jgi:hypothetical protein